MNRLFGAYKKSRSVFLKEHQKYEYKYLLPMVLLLLIGGHFVGGTIGDILFVLGLIGSPLFFILESFWVFVIYLIKPGN